MIKWCCVLLFIVVESACVEFRCYSNEDHAIAQANEFCSQANQDKMRCESLKIVDQVCAIANKYDNACMATSKGIETFIRIPYNDCKNMNQKTCEEKKYCQWNFKDPLHSRYGSFFGSPAKNHE
jgi:hypothetical protein